LLSVRDKAVSAGRSLSERGAFTMSVACPREAQIAPFLGPESRGQKAGLEPCKAMPVGVCMEPESEFKTAIPAQM
jgi:hypothetical protein